MSDTEAIAAALADSIRRRVVELLAERPHRTHELAAATAMTPARLSRHLGILRAARLVERRDVDGDARGREYRLRAGGIGPYRDWLTTTWARTLANEHDRDAAVLLGRLGEFLDAFGRNDIGFFERHLHPDVLLVFPGMQSPIDKAQCLAEVSGHPRWLRYDIASDPTVKQLAGHSLITASATVAHDADVDARQVIITALFADTDPWSLLHLQWTSAATTKEQP